MCSTLAGFLVNVIAGAIDAQRNTNIPTGNVHKRNDNKEAVHTANDKHNSNKEVIPVAHGAGVVLAGKDVPQNVVVIGSVPSANDVLAGVYVNNIEETEDNEDSKNGLMT